MHRRVQNYLKIIQHWAISQCLSVSYAIKIHDVKAFSSLKDACDRRWNSVSKYGRCCFHDTLGKPSALQEVHDEDWAPTVNLGHNKVKRKTEAAKERDQRSNMREEKRRKSEGAEILLSLHKQQPVEVQCDLLGDQEKEETYNVQQQGMIWKLLMTCTLSICFISWVLGVLVLNFSLLSWLILPDCS